MDFEGKTVVVTGGARGIGRACVEAFARNGANVMVNFHSSKEEATGLAETNQRTVALHQADIADEAQVKALFDTVNERFGRASILVNNAGIVNREKFPDITAEAFERILKINTIGPFLAAREFARQAGDDGGSIVNIGSMRAFVPTIPDYSASKAALHNLTISLAKELAPAIRVNTVAPGFTDTDMHRDNPERLEREAARSLLQRYSSPADIADAVLFLASGKARSITGQILLVDNGRSLSE